MVEKYFDKFQLINYSNTTAVNITERAVVLNSILKNPYLMYPSDISDGVRADQLSDTYYKDQYMSWILYLSNGIIDPYYQWYIQPEEFEGLLRKKYNYVDINILKQKVAFFRNNWYADDKITVSEFNSFIPEEKIYWQPIYGVGNYPINYERIPQDWTITTNQMVQLDLFETEQTFIKDEIVNIYFNDDHKGKAQVVVANSTAMTIQHTFGSTHANTTVIISGDSYIFGTESKSNVQFTAANLVYNNIGIALEKYWSPVYIYDTDVEKNEYNKSIKLLNAAYAPQAAKELKNLLA